MIPTKSELLTQLLEKWASLYTNDQSVLLEAVDHLLVPGDLKMASQKSLELALENLKQDPHSQRSHIVLFVRDTFVSIYSRYDVL